MLTKEEKRYRTYMIVLCWIYIAAMILCLIDVLRFFRLITFLAGIFCLLNAFFCWFSVADLRRYVLFSKAIIWNSAITAIFLVGILIWGERTGRAFIAGIPVLYKTLILTVAVYKIIVAVLTSVLFTSAEKSRYNLKYFSSIQFHTLSALAEVIIAGEKEILTGDEVAQNVDTYFSKFEARSKWTMALVVSCLYFYPILNLLPPLPYIAPDRRLTFLKRKFYSDIESRILPEFWREIVQGMIRIAKQMCYIGYYNDPRTFASVGYIPFSQRRDFAERLAKSPVTKTPELHVKSQKDIKDGSIESDVVIIGSGAAAAILAKGLVENGRKVLLVERGYYEKPETYTENEMEMVARLYHDGAIQAARDFRFTVFQGSCVGGSTVLNNAVCFKMPEEVIDKWNDQGGLNAGLNKSKVMKSMDRVWDMIGVNHMEESVHKLNPGGYFFRNGFTTLGFNVSAENSNSVYANIRNCLGCGYCNIGCAYNKKLSMIITLLPQTQAKYGKDKLEILAGCEAIKLHKDGRKIKYVEGRFKDNKKVKIHGKTFIVSAGDVSSSILLLKSNLGLKNAGQKLSFNIGSQITAAFPFKVDSFDGLQISHFIKNRSDSGFIMESWFNPPMFQSTAMPGWFEDHYNNMRRYDRLACVGILAGSESNARVRIAGLTGREIDYTPSKKDFETLLNGIVLAGEIMLASGAESVMPNTFRYHEFKTVDELRGLHKLVKDSSEITLGTGHPQGGNILSSNGDKGVVNPEFKAFGYDNLFVCDASVFPSSVGVNPQVTVMGLADYAVDFIKKN